MTFRTISLLAVLLVLPLATACQNSILFTTSNLTGLELNTVEGGQQTAKLGYQRFEGVVMPMRTRELADGTVIYEEAYSVLAATSMQSKGFLTSTLSNVRITQVFATGRAAVQENAGKVLQKAVAALSGKLLTEEQIVSFEDFAELTDKHEDDPAKMEVIYATVNDELELQGTSKVSTPGKAQAAVRAALDSGKSDSVKAILTKLQQAGL
jgi:hypothetical protein